MFFFSVDKVNMIYDDGRLTSVSLLMATDSAYTVRLRDWILRFTVLRTNNHAEIYDGCLMATDYGPQLAKKAILRSLTEDEYDYTTISIQESFRLQNTMAMTEECCYRDSRGRIFPTLVALVEQAHLSPSKQVKFIALAKE
jgi:hypothetical protein